MIEFEKQMNIVKLPTFADVHVHLREPGATHKEDFSTGTMAAVAGGYTQVLDMPNNNPPTISPEAISTKTSLASGKIWCDVGFNFGASIQSAKYFTKIKNNVFALKVYMNQTTGDLLVDKTEERDLVFRQWDSTLPIMVHAEGQTVEVAIALAKKYKRKLHVCHVTSDQITTIKKAKKDNLEISCEVCPHHLFLSQDDLPKLGSFGQMKPQLLTESERKKLWDNLEDIEMISTDHAPHTVDEKQDTTSPKFGVPGLETTLPLMLWAVDKKMFTLSQLTKMLSTNPRKIFNLPDQPNTYMEVNLSKKFKIKELNLFTKCQWTPFDSLDGVGKIRKVILRGESILENGKFIGNPRGEIIIPKNT